MAPSASHPARTPAEPPRGQPNVRAIMAGLRKTIHEKPRVVAVSDRDLAARLRHRMTRPLGGRRFSEGFVQGVRSGDPSRWNLQRDPQGSHGPASAWTRLVRAVFGPLVRRAMDPGPVQAVAARQSDINEYYRRLLWATNRDLIATRTELNLLKQELLRLGIHIDPIAPAEADGPPAAPEPRRPPRRRGRGRRRGRPARGGPKGS